jgi:hypothetical protein
MLDPLSPPAREKLEKELAQEPWLQKRNLHQTVRIMVEGVTGALTKQMLSGDASGVHELLSGQDTQPGSPVVGALLPAVASYLAPHLGISIDEARNLSRLSIPLVLNTLNGKIARARQRGTDVSHLISQLIEATGNLPALGSRHGQQDRIAGLLESLLKV